MLILMALLVLIVLLFFSVDVCVFFCFFLLVFQEDFEEENWSKLGGEVIFISILSSSSPISKIFSVIICVTVNIHTFIIVLIFTNQQNIDHVCLCKLDSGDHC